MPALPISNKVITNLQHKKNFSGIRKNTTSPMKTNMGNRETERVIVGGEGQGRMEREGIERRKRRRRRR